MKALASGFSLGLVVDEVVEEVVEEGCGLLVSVVSAFFDESLGVSVLVVFVGVAEAFSGEVEVLEAAFLKPG